MPAFRTVAAAMRHEIPRIKGSRFLGDAAPATSGEDAMAVVERVRAEHPHATHHCFAWRLGLGEDDYRTSDDGEPSGTAGLPILRRIDGFGVTNVVVVVTRWFGGTKLGTGGLVRAYGECAAAALGQCDVIEARVSRALTIRCGYALHGNVRGALSAAGIEPTGEDFGADVIVRVSVPVEDAPALVAEVLERTAGQAIVSG